MPRIPRVQAGLISRAASGLRTSALQALDAVPHIKDVKEHSAFIDAGQQIKGLWLNKLGTPIKNAKQISIQANEPLYTHRVTKALETLPPLREFHRLVMAESGELSSRSIKSNPHLNIRGSIKRTSPTFNSLVANVKRATPGSTGSSLSGSDSLFQALMGRVSGSQATKAYKASKEAKEAYLAAGLKVDKLTGKVIPHKSKVRQTLRELRALAKSAKVAGHVVAARTSEGIRKNPNGSFYDPAKMGKFIPESVGGQLNARNLVGISAVGYGASRLYHHGFPKNDPYGTKRYKDYRQNPRDWSNKPYFENMRIPQRTRPRRVG